MKKIIGSKNITKNNCRIEANDSLMCEYFCIKFIDLMLKKVNFYEIIPNFFS